MKKIDYLIIGAGPAGCQMAHHFEKSNNDYVILEKADKPGAFFSKFPRHRTLISINKVNTGFTDPDVNLRWDWNSILSETSDIRFSDYTREYFPGADNLVTYLKDYVEKHQLNVAYNSEVIEVNKVDDEFVVSLRNGEVYQSKFVIVGTGLFKPYVPEIPGIELCENYTECSVDPDDYTNKRVLIVGKGNSGFETADNLVETAATIHIVSPNSLKLAWQTHFVGHLRAINNNFLDTYQLKSQNAILDADIKNIRKEDGRFIVSFEYSHAKGELEDITYDNVIISTGFRFDTSIYKGAAKPNLAINSRFPEQTYEWESTNVKNMYFIGAITQQRDYKKHTSAFIHGFRYNVACLAKIIDFKNNYRPFPLKVISSTAKVATDALIGRINKTSALWQQFGFIADLMVVSPGKSQARYYETLPVDYINKSKNWDGFHQFVLTLEYGKFEENEDVFAIQRDPDSAKASDSKFLHPVIRHVFKGEVVSEHHIIEDLETDWTKEEMHIKPLREYLENEFARINNNAFSSTKEYNLNARLEQKAS